MPGYIIVQSRRHVSSIAQLSMLESLHFNRIIQKSVRILETHLKPERVYIFGVGEQVRHLHIHLFPRWDWMTEKMGNETGIPFIARVLRERPTEGGERTLRTLDRLKDLFSRIPATRGRKMPIQVEVIPFRRVASGVEYLMLRRVPDRGGFWQPVTGGMDEGETMQETALRELYEETGVMDVHSCFPISHTFQFDLPDGRTLTEFCMAAEMGDEDVRLSKEHDNFRWTNFETARGLMKWPGNIRALELLDASLKAGA